MRHEPIAETLQAYIGHKSLLCAIQGVAGWLVYIYPVLLLLVLAFPAGHWGQFTGLGQYLFLLCAVLLYAKLIYKTLAYGLCALAVTYAAWFAKFLIGGTFSLTYLVHASIPAILALLAWSRYNAQKETAVVDHDCDNPVPVSKSDTGIQVQEKEEPLIVEPAQTSGRVRSCPNCRNTVSKQAAFCGNCGNALLPLAPEDAGDIPMDKPEAAKMPATLLSQESCKETTEEKREAYENEPQRRLPYEKICPHCQRNLKPEAVFCSGCGKKLVQ